MPLSFTDIIACNQRIRDIITLLKTGEVSPREQLSLKEQLKYLINLLNEDSERREEEQQSRVRPQEQSPWFAEANPREKAFESPLREEKNSTAESAPKTYIQEQPLQASPLRQEETPQKEPEAPKEELSPAQESEESPLLSTAFLDSLVPVTSVEEMRAWDAAAVRYGIPDAVLMENAARSALSVLLHYKKELRGLRVALFMGSGNNGGDAATLARMLLDCGASPVVFHLRPLEKAKGSADLFIQAARACGVPFQPFDQWTAGRWDIIVDGLLGTGAQGQVRDDYAKCIEAINQTDAFILALDIPSGLDAMTGKPLGSTVKANATVTFAALKLGVSLPQARPYTGQVFVSAIGTPVAVQKEIPSSYRLLSNIDLQALAPQRDGHKGSYGHVLILGGAPGMSGAGRLSARAAFRAGAGLVSLASPLGGAASKCTDPEVMTREFSEATWPHEAYSEDGSFSKEGSERMLESIADLINGKATALALGPGMGREKNAKIFTHLLLAREKRPACVVDADGLVVLGKEGLCLLRENDVITPHPGEAALLLGCSVQEVQQDRLAALRKLCALTKAVCVLKGAGTLIGQGKYPICILPEDIPQLSCAGSGDILTGIVAALLARGLSALEAASYAVVWHARAGKSFSSRGILASEIADILPDVLQNSSQTEGIVNGGQVCFPSL